MFLYISIELVFNDIPNGLQASKWGKLHFKEMSHHCLLRGVSRPYHSAWVTSRCYEMCTSSPIIICVSALSSPPIFDRQWSISCLLKLRFPLKIILNIHLYRCSLRYIFAIIKRYTPVTFVTCTEAVRRNAFYWPSRWQSCDWHVIGPIRLQMRRDYSAAPWRGCCLPEDEASRNLHYVVHQHRMKVDHL